MNIVSGAAGLARVAPEDTEFLQRPQIHQGLQQATGLLEAQNRILKMIATGARLDETLAELMRFIEAREEGVRCGILTVSDDGRHLRPGAGPNLPQLYHVAFDDMPIAPPFRAPCIEAVHKNSDVLVPDVANDSRWSDTWRELARSCGFASMRSTPVRGSDGRVLASLAMYCDRPLNPPPAHPRLIEIAVHLAGIALERDRSERALREKERQYRETLEALPVAVYTTDAEGRITFFNQAAAHLAGRQPQLGTDDWCVTWRLYRPDGTPLPHDQCPMAVALKENRAIRGEEAIAERSDGTRVPFVPYPTPVHDDSGALVGAVNTLIDITAIREASGAIARQAEEQGALYRYTDRLYRAEKLDDVYDAALDAIGRALHCNRASILLFDDAGVMRFVAARGLSEGYKKAVEGHTPWKPDDRDPRPICIQDIDTANETEALKNVVRAEGIRALAFIPLVANGGVVGKFMTYYEAPHVFTSQEIELALTIARQLGFSLERARAKDAQRRVEAALRESEERMRAVFASAAVGAAILTPDARFIQANEAFCSITGYSVAELRALDCTALTHPDDRAPMQQLLSDLLAGTIPSFDLQKRYFRKDGAVIWVQNSVSLTRDPAGQPRHLVALCQDVTERKGTEQIAQQFASIVAFSNDAIVSKDLNGIVISWNSGAQRLFGYSAEEMIGKSITILIPSDRHNEEPAILERIRRGERVEPYDTVRRRKDGSLVDISLTISPVKDGSGRIVGASKIARDITERKRAQEQQTLVLREMSHRVNNLFAITNSLVTLTARSAATPAEMAKTVRERLTALAAAHGLVRPHLIGFGTELNRGTTLDALVRAIVSPYLDSARGKGHQGLVANGPEITVGANAVTSLALVLHEFATNAAKYGALSSQRGSVQVDWSAGEGALVLQWTERGGPPLQGSPTEEGFGSLLAQRTVAEQLGGKISREWNRDGLTVRLSLRLEALAA